MKFEAIIENKVLRPWVTSVSAVVDECVLAICKNGFRTVAVDPANVCMVRARLNDSAFESYNQKSDTDGAIRYGIDTNLLLDVLSLCPMNKSVQLSLLVTEPNTMPDLFIRCEHMEYKLSLLNPDGIRKEPKVPKMDLPISFKIPIKCVFDVVKATVKLKHDHARFHYHPHDNDKAFMMSTQYGNTNEVKAEFPRDLLTSIKVDETKTARLLGGQSISSYYSMDYMSDIFRGLTCFDPRGTKERVQIDMGNDYPIVMTYDRTGAVVSYLLAPRIESD